MFLWVWFSLFCEVKFVALIVFFLLILARGVVVNGLSSGLSGVPKVGLCGDTCGTVFVLFTFPKTGSPFLYGFFVGIIGVGISVELALLVSRTGEIFVWSGFLKTGSPFL